MEMLLHSILLHRHMTYLLPCTVSYPRVGHAGTHSFSVAHSRVCPEMPGKGKQKRERATDSLDI